ncbi:dual specificity protein phosphatase family protein [Halomicroarcula limicola]|uniref:Dual specificity protein phosphatase family protein n=1 Tax=Haloarcula limicola TaxID=1429915 RepID=A0A8J8C6I5_9EURY|nr:dual specificity protein phosphatase family protein [Halomicroarcula limicola]MBV0922615.1 dual specificity protein phosphatase family protein [Halomicroarcula limicola]
MRPANAHRFAPAAPDEEYVFGSCTPGWHSAASHSAALADWISTMRESDVERVCCLLPGRQLDESGANLDRYRDAFGESNVLHAPVPDHRLVPESLLRGEILPFLAAARNDEARVVVHCLAGIGRTGQVLAAWLVYNRDYGPDRAIETVEEMGRDARDAVVTENATDAELVDLLGSVARR